MNAANVTLSPVELALVNDSEWILTKQQVMHKAALLLELLSRQLKKAADANPAFPAQAWQQLPKISKGEQYKGLPYMVLDYPRIFSREHVFAVRTFFWWANYFSISLQVSGDYRKWLNLEKIGQQLLSNSDWWIAVGDDPWQHDLSSGAFKCCNMFSEVELFKHLHNHPFLKFSRPFQLNHWNQLPEVIGKGYESLVAMF
jgi:hypothetical protein